MYITCLIFHNVSFGPLYVPFDIYCQVYPFPSFVKKGILCSIVDHVLKKTHTHFEIRERMREILIDTDNRKTINFKIQISNGMKNLIASIESKFWHLIQGYKNYGWNTSWVYRGVGGNVCYYKFYFWNQNGS